MWEEIRIIFAGRIECEAYKLALDKTEYLNYVLEEMRMCESNFAKEKFIKEIAKWTIENHQNLICHLANLHTEIPQKRECYQDSEN